MFILSVILGIVLMQVSKKIENEYFNHIIWFSGLVSPLVVAYYAFKLTDIQESIFGIVAILLMPLVNYFVGYFIDKLRNIRR